MRLKSIGDRIQSMTPSGGGMSRSPGRLWRALNQNLTESLTMPSQRIFVALDKDSLSLVYAINRLGKSSIQAYRQYAYEWKPQNTISRKYLYNDGQLPRPEILASTLELFVSEFDASEAKIVLCIPKAWTIYRSEDLPAAVEENLDDVVAMELDRLVSIQPEKAYYDYRVVNQNKEQIRIAIAAARLDMIKSYTTLLEEKGFEVEKIVTSLSVMGHLLSARFGAGAFVFIEVHPTDYEVSAIQGNRVHFAHRQKFGLFSPEAKAKDIIEELDHLAEQLSVIASPKIVIHGEREEIEAIADNMSRSVMLLPANGIKTGLSGAVTEMDALAAAGAFEIVTRKTDAYHLKTRQTEKSDFFPSLKVSAYLVALIILVFGIGYFAPLFLERSYMAEIDRHIDRRHEEYRRVEPQKSELDAILETVKAVKNFKNSAPPAILLLDDLTRRIPDAFWLSSLRLSDHRLEMDISVTGTIKDVIDALEASPYLQNVEMVDMGVDDDIGDHASTKAVLTMDIVNQPAMEAQPEVQDEKQ